jgi:hypothetical protein
LSSSSLMHAGMGCIVLELASWLVSVLRPPLYGDFYKLGGRR